MRTVLAILLAVAAAGLAHAQTANQEAARRMVERGEALRVALQVQSTDAFIRDVTIRADQMSRDQSVLRLQGNVVIRFADGTVVTADSAEVHDRSEIRLGANARVIIPQR